jgi:RNA polymerase sigma factor (sigma-70 family)
VVNDGPLVEQFEADRSRLRAVAYRMLGSLTEADDAVQETWLRLSNAQPGSIDNLRAWLTTVVSRICLDMLRSRKARREEPLDAWVPDPIISGAPGPVGADPEANAVLTDSVGLALLVMLETLKPAERLAFVLHDMFMMPFDEIAMIIGRSPGATKMLASRARRRLPTATAKTESGSPRSQRLVVEAFLSAARRGDFAGLVAILDPDVTLRADTGATRALVHGNTVVASRAVLFSQRSTTTRPVWVNGAPGVLTISADGALTAVMGFTVTADKITEMYLLADPNRLAALELDGQAA